MGRATWIALALVSLGCMTTAKPEGFEAAANEARQNRRDPGAYMYLANLQRKLQRPLEVASRVCRVRTADSRNVRILYRLDASGAVAETLLYPSTDYGQCVLEEIGTVEFAAPPESDYWVRVAVPPFSTPYR